MYNFLIPEEALIRGKYTGIVLVCFGCKSHFVIFLEIIYRLSVLNQDLRAVA